MVKWNNPVKYVNDSEVMALCASGRDGNNLGLKRHAIDPQLQN